MKLKQRKGFHSYIYSTCIYWGPIVCQQLHGVKNTHTQEKLTCQEEARKSLWSPWQMQRKIYRKWGELEEGHGKQPSPLEGGVMEREGTVARAVWVAKGIQVFSSPFLVTITPEVSLKCWQCASPKPHFLCFQTYVPSGHHLNSPGPKWIGTVHAYQLKTFRIS